MTFTSLTFVLFLALMFAGYWGIRRRRGQNALLVLGSYFFYGWWDYRFCALILLSSLTDFGIGIALNRARSAARRRGLLLISLLVNLGALAFFKYCGFFAESFAHFAALFGWRLGHFELAIVLPVGISFYTFQTLSYTIDVYRRQLSPTTRIVDYLAYVSFFPQLVAGPIERGHTFLPQFLRPRVFDRELAIDGCRQILWGFFKKMVLADGLAVIVDSVYTDADSRGAQLALATVCFGFQIYCDFSAYSDIAIGTGRLFGFRLMRNFAYPYFAQSVAEFWRRWHISLSTWFRDYLYIPLGGSRAGSSRRVFNVLTTFVVSGLWHGASWNFVIWGAIHGLAMIPGILLRAGSRERRLSDVPGVGPLVPRVSTLLRMARTFLLVSLAWVFFRAPTLPDALSILQRIFSDSLNVAALGTVGDLLWARKRIFSILAAFILIEWLQRRHDHPLQGIAWATPFKWALYTALFWASLAFAAPLTGQFIYFQF